MYNPYSVHNEKDVADMLDSMGLTHIEQLLQCIPENIRLKRDLHLPAPLEEGQLDNVARQRASANQTTLTRISFLGGGVYEHHVPAVVDYLSERGELLTSYTPYQPKMSQGSLEILWEYQNKLQAIVGLPVVNASSYDGSTALVDAFNMVCYQASDPRNCDLLMAETLWPQTRLIVESSLAGKENKIALIGYSEEGCLDHDHLETYLDLHRPAAFAFQCPNAFGVMEDMEAIARLCKKYNVTSIVYYHPFLSGIFQPPGLLGIDIVCGEGQMLGNHLNAGGATFGFLGCRQVYAHAIPGRIVGIKTDEAGQPYYALVNEEREQHVARDKATSNICSNQANCVMRATFYLSALGDQGLCRLALKNVQAAHDFCQKLCAIEGIKRKFDAPFFNEFMIELPVNAGEFYEKVKARGIYAGILHPMPGFENCLLLAVTETKDDAQLDYAVQVFDACLRGDK